jgi:hypothetical protein
MARSLSTLFFFFFFFFSLFCGLRNSTFSEGEARVDINEPATGLTQDRVVLSQGSQMRCRVEPGMDRLRRNISSFAAPVRMVQKIIFGGVRGVLGNLKVEK